MKNVSNWVFYFLLVVLFIFIYPYVFDSKLFLGGDNASYYSLAQSIANDFAYKDFFSPLNLPANHYPPGYPFILAIAIKLGVESLFGLKVLSGLFLLGSVLLTFKIALRLLTNQWAAFFVALIVMLNYHILEFSSITMSEIPFMFFLLFTFYSFLRFVDEGFKLKSLYFILTLLGVIAVVYIRAQGIAILGAFVFYLLLKKEWKSLAVLVGVFLIAYMPWQIRSANLGGSSYVKQLLRVNPYSAESPKMELKDWGERVANNAVRYTSKEIPSLMFSIGKLTYNNSTDGKPLPAKASYWVGGICVLLFSFFGMWSMKKWRWLLFSFFGANVLIFMLWPDVWFGIRFILPLFSLILIVFVEGIKQAIQLVYKNDFVLKGKVYLLIILPLILVSFPSLKALNAKANGKFPANWANFLYTAEWAKDNLKPTDVVVARKPELFAFISGTKSKTFVYTENMDTLKNDFEKHKVTHVVFEQLGFTQTGKYLYPMLVKEPDRFELMYNLGAREGLDKQGNKTLTQDGVWVYKYHADKGYSGPYVNGMKNGKGKYVYQNGDVFEGTWVNDTIHGNGVLKKIDGQVITGNLVKGQREGVFTIFSKENNTYYESVWVNNVLEEFGYVADSIGNRQGRVKLR